MLAIPIAIACYWGYRQYRSNLAPLQYRNAARQNIDDENAARRKLYEDRIRAVKQLVEVERDREELDIRTQQTPIANVDLATAVANYNEAIALEERSNNLRKEAQVIDLSGRKISGPCPPALEVAFMFVQEFLTPSDKLALALTSKTAASVLGLQTQVVTALTGNNEKEKKTLELSLACKDLAVTVLSEVARFLCPQYVCLLNTVKEGVITVDPKLFAAIIQEVTTRYEDPKNWTINADGAKVAVEEFQSILQQLLDEHGLLKTIITGTNIREVDWCSKQCKFYPKKINVLLCLVSLVGVVMAYALCCHGALDGIDGATIAKVLFDVLVVLVSFTVGYTASIFFGLIYALYNGDLKRSFSKTSQSWAHFKAALANIPKDVLTPSFVLKNMLINPAEYFWKEDVQPVIEGISSSLNNAVAYCCTHARQWIVGIARCRPCPIRFSWWP